MQQNKSATLLYNGINAHNTRTPTTHKLGNSPIHINLINIIKNNNTTMNIQLTFSFNPHAKMR